MEPLVLQLMMEEPRSMVYFIYRFQVSEDALFPTLIRMVKGTCDSKPDGMIDAMAGRCTLSRMIA